jgi:hypothetical protein
VRQQLDVKDSGTLLLFILAEQVHQQRPNSAGLQDAGNKLVSWAKSAASAAMCEDHDRLTTPRQTERSLEFSEVDQDSHLGMANQMA